MLSTLLTLVECAFAIFCLLGLIILVIGLIVVISELVGIHRIMKDDKE